MDRTKESVLNNVVDVNKQAVLNFDEKGQALITNQGVKSALVEQIRGTVTTVLNAISATTTSAAVDCTGYKACHVSVAISGTGTWQVDLQAALSTDGTYMDVYDNNDTQLTTGVLSGSRMKMFCCIPSTVKVVATKVSGTGTCTVRVQPFNV